VAPDPRRQILVQRRLDVGQVGRALHDTKSTALWHSPVKAFTTSMPSPLKSMKVFSPARCACLVVAESGLAHRK
jgi:hypothetical protein